MTKKAAKLNADYDLDKPETLREGGRVERIVLTTDDELDEILADSPQNEACIELSRINAQGGRPAFLEDMMPSAFSYGYVTKTYGGGRYMAKAKYANGDKKKMFFEIEGDPFPVRRKYVATNPDAPVLPNMPRSIETETLQPVRADGVGLEGMLASLMSQMMRQAQSTETQILEKMKMYKELFGNNQPTKEAPLDQLLSMFQKGVELAGKGGGGGDENFWISIAREVKDPLMKLAETVHSAVTVGRQPTQINPPNGPAASPPNQGGGAIQPGAQPAPQPGDPMLALMPIIKQIMPNLVNAAAKNLDPELYAGFVIDQTPETAYSGFREWLMKPGCLDQLAFLEPGVRFQRDWWEELRGELLKQLTEPTHADSSVQPLENSDPSNESATHSDSLS